MSLKPAGIDKVIVTIKIDESHILTCTAVDKKGGRKYEIEPLWKNVLSLTDEEFEMAKDRLNAA